MGAKPSIAAVTAYLKHVEPFYQASSLVRMRRAFRTIIRDTDALHNDGKLSTTNPGKLNENDIGQLLLYWQQRLDSATQQKYLSTLNNLLRFIGNPVIDQMRQKRTRFPRALNKPIRVLGEEELKTIQIGTDLMTGWPGSVMRFLVRFLPATGLRPKEVRLARLEDLDLQKWRILVSHPKGEQVWAAPAFAPILPPGRQALADFLRERSEYLDGQNSDLLIPLKRPDGTVTEWSDAYMRRMKGFLERATGIRFSLKTFRSTFAQTAKNRGASIEAVSKALRHKNTVTTERYYARMTDDNAFAELEEVFGD